ncbi:MAG: hypothetical protein GWO41_02005, partial [candidate division Zixibacteria bacterium]|nr:hypothetical protein [candidate division Zixibacteria bacterium]NIX57439.1 hypothetical protein [candidate division Zixibacteria bacterium]
MNSSVIHFYLTQTAETSGMGTSRWINNHVKEFPIVIANDDVQRAIGIIAEYCALTTEKGH